MNIEILLDNISLFESEIIESGFKRDIQDYLASLPNNQNNIVTLRDVAEKIKDSLTRIYNADLPDALNQLFPKKKIRPFTETNHLKNIIELIDNKEIQLADFFSKLSNLLTQLNSQLQENITEVTNLKSIFSPYASKDKEYISSQNKATLAILFKDKNTITSLKHFSKILSVWNRTLPLYHQIIKSSSPEDIEIVEVQNGSIDFVFNIDVDVAINLVELFKIGLKSYLAYLTYKSLIKPITESYLGNKKLIDSEVDREKELLNNISIALLDKINEQNIEAKKLDKKVDDKIDKKAEEVTKLISSHIVRGNDIKLLALPENIKENKEGMGNINNSKKELQQASLDVRNTLKKLPLNDIKKLLDKYGNIDDTNNEN